MILGVLGMYAEAPFDRITSLGGQLPWIRRMTIVRLLVLLVVAVIVVPLLSQFPWWVSVIAYFAGGYASSELIGASRVNAACALAGISWGGVMVIITDVMGLTGWAPYAKYVPAGVVLFMIGVFLWSFLTTLLANKKDDQRNAPDSPE